MKKNIKALLYLIVALPLFIMGCSPEPEPEPQPEPKPEPQPEVLDPILTLSTQEVSLSPEAETVTISYTLENPREGVTLKAECDAEWISNIVVGEQSISFYVAKNQSQQREAVLKVSYGTTTARATIKQEAFNGLYFTASILSGDFYHKDTLYWTAHNYYFTLSDAVIDRENPVPDSTYFYFDLYSETETEDGSIPSGTYILDPESQWLAGTLNGGKTYGFKINSIGTDYAEKYLFTEGVVIIGERSIEAEFTCEDGFKVYVSYEGDLALTPHYPEEKHLSTLYGDVELNYTNVTLSASYYGDYYTADSDNWTVRLYEDPERQNGLFIQLELLTDPNASDWQLCYNALQDNSLSDPANYINTYIKGYLENNNIAGSWYAVLKDGKINYDMAPIMDGTIDISLNSDGSSKFIFDCVDDAGNKITGTVTSVVQ